MCDCTARLRADAERLLAQGDRLKAMGHHKNAEASRRHAMSLALAVGHLKRPPERPMTDTLVTIAPCKRTIACTLEADHHGVCRDKWTRPLIQRPDGKTPVWHYRATKYVDVLEDRYNIERWQMRYTAVGLAISPDILLEVGGTPVDDRDALNALCEKAMKASNAYSKRDRGTRLHKLTEYADAGLDLPPETTDVDRAAVQAYTRATRDWTFLQREQLTVLDSLKVAGTPDAIAEVPTPDPDGVVATRICDLKTGDMDYGQLKTAGQLALYSRSQSLDVATWERTLLPEVNQQWGVVLDMDPDTAQVELRWIDLTLGWEVVEEATTVRAFRRRASTAFRPFTRDFDLQVTPAVLLGLIALADDVDALTALWAEHKDTWTPEHTAAAAARKATLTASAA